MVDLEKIKRDAKELCNQIEVAMVALGDRDKEYSVQAAKILAINENIKKLNERKGIVATDVRVECEAAAIEKKKYTAAKKKCKNLIKDENLRYAQILGEHEAEIEKKRIQALYILNAEQGKIVNETKAMKSELDTMRKEYISVKKNLQKIKEGIAV